MGTVVGQSEFVAFRVYTHALAHQRLMRRAALVAELTRCAYNPDAAIWMTLPCGALMLPRAGELPLWDARCLCGAHWIVRYECDDAQMQSPAFEARD